MGPGAQLPESCELRSRNTFRAGSPGAKMQFVLFSVDIVVWIPSCCTSRRRCHPPAGRLVPLGHTLSAARDRESSLMLLPSVPEIPRMEAYVNWLFVVALLQQLPLFSLPFYCLLFTLVYPNYMSHRRSVFHFLRKILP